MEQTAEVSGISLDQVIAMSQFVGAVRDLRVAQRAGKVWLVRVRRSLVERRALYCVANGVSASQLEALEQEIDSLEPSGS